MKKYLLAVRDGLGSEIYEFLTKRERRSMINTIRKNMPKIKYALSEITV